jgi:glutamine amidotransferase
LGIDAQVTEDPIAVSRAYRLVLPGVGAFDPAVTHLARTGLREAVIERILAGVPTLGICLGMQLFANWSEEGSLAGLGWISGHVRRLGAGSTGSRELRVPHMGWNTVSTSKPHFLFDGIDPSARFYFAHSYHFVCDSESDVLATTTYGAPFASAVARENVIGIQFHPEKSHALGLQILSRFVVG